MDCVFPRLPWSPPVALLWPTSLLYILACVHAKSSQSCLTLCDPLDCSLPGSSVHGILQARILGWVAIFLLQGIFLTQGLNPALLHFRQILYF